MLRFSVLIISLLLFLSCDEELSINPLDVENNPEYVEPETTITNTDLDGSTLDTSAVTISFGGNDLVVEYAYSFNGSDYSDWTTSTSATYDYLDEGAYTFSVKGRYVTGDEDETPATIGFTVDAIQGPALALYPRRHITTSNNPVTFQLMAEEVDSLMSATITISYDTASLEIISVSQGDIFTGTGVSVFIDESASGSLIINTMFMGGDSPSVSGTGILAILQVKALTTGSHTLSLDGTQLLKTHTNRSITITQTVNGLVVIE